MQCHVSHRGPLDLCPPHDSTDSESIVGQTKLGCKGWDGLDSGGSTGKPPRRDHPKMHHHIAKPRNYIPETITNRSVSDITFHFPCCSPVARNRSVDSLPGGRPLAARIRSIAVF